MSDHLTVSEAARELSGRLGTVIPPRAISDLLYKRRLRDDLCPIVGGRRLIPRDYLSEIADMLGSSAKGDNPQEGRDVV